MKVSFRLSTVIVFNCLFPVVSLFFISLSIRSCDLVFLCVFDKKSIFVLEVLLQFLSEIQARFFFLRKYQSFKCLKILFRSTSCGSLTHNTQFRHFFKKFFQTFFTSTFFCKLLKMSFQNHILCPNLSF